MENTTATSQLDKQLDKIADRNTSNRTVGVGGYVFWGLALPPFTTIWTIYSASKKGVLHILVPTMALVYSIFFALFSFTVIYSPKSFNDVSAVKFSQKLNIPSVPSWITVSTIILTILGIFGGWYLRRLAKSQGSLSKVLMAVLLIVILLQLFVEFRELVFINTVIREATGGLLLGL